MSKNVIFTAFANPKGDLSSLTNEQNGIQDAILPAERHGKLAKHLIRTDTDLIAYFDFLREYQDRISIFHYAGHADSAGISLQNAHIFFEPLARELTQRNPNALQLVVLNGCCTRAHIKILFQFGVKAVIATSVKIHDETATQFAIRFYENLVAGDTLGMAYESAANFIKGSNTEQRYRHFGKTHRDIGFDTPTDETPDEFPWGLYTNGNDAVLQHVFFAQNAHADAPPITSTNNKNTVINSTITAGGNVHIGDKNITQNAEKIINIEKIDNANFS